MEKQHYPKIAILLIFLLLMMGPFGLFIYSFLKVTIESIMSATSVTLPFILPGDLIFSIVTGLISTMLSVLIGAAISFNLIRCGKGKFSYGIFNIVLVLPHIGFAYIVFLFFSQTGFLYRVLDLFGFSVFFNLINDTLGVGIILNYILKEVPFVILYLLATHKQENSGHFRAASDLGASRTEIFTRIFLPLNMVQITTISIVLFAYIIGNYEVPFLLGANAPQFLSVSALDNFQSIDPEQNIAAYTKVVIIFATAFIMSFIFKTCARWMK